MNIDRKKVFSTLEKDLFLNIIQKYDSILSCKQTNATSAYKKKATWETIKEDFNTSSIVTQQASTKQLIKLWYNMKAKARESRTKENIRHLTGGGPAVADMNPIDAKVMDIDKNILTNIAVDIDGSVFIIGDDNNEAWNKCNDVIVTKSDVDTIISATPKKIKNTADKINKIDYLKCQILEEELEYKKRIHEEELKMKIIEGKSKEKVLNMELEYKEKIFKMELEYKEKIFNVELDIRNKMLTALNK